MTFTPETTLLLIAALRFFQGHGLVERSAGYSIDVWDDTGNHIQEHMATAGNFQVATAAFGAVCVIRPGREITLRHGARVLTRQASQTR